MMNKIFNRPSTRFALVFQTSVVALAGFALMRVFFLVRSWTVIDHGIADLVYMSGRGLVYDLAFVGYVYIPFVIVLSVIPDRWFKTAAVRATAQATVFSIVYALCFSMVAEWLFWDEFGVRFNFISVDYLVYRREVTDNILESYPVFWILPILLILTTFIFYLMRPSLLRAMAVGERFSRRAGIALCLLLVPVASFFFLGQSQRSQSSNNYENEIASNGPYQLFAAFRNNTLDFRQFYTTGDDTTLSQTLKQAVFDQSDTPHDHKLYNIARHIRPAALPKRLNVILISVESLSAKFLTRFGQQENITPFMDKWFKQGLLFTNFYATGTRTTRGLEAITLSIPPTPGRSIVKRPDNDHMFSLGKVFKDNGYDTAFLYGGRGYFDNMNTFFSGNGYRIVDQTSLSDGEVTFKNAWGVSDEDLYNRAVVEADSAYNSNKPFFFHIMTTSNHRPFTYPGGKIDLVPGEGKNGAGRSGAVKYTDYALGRLIKSAKGKPWFDNTVFVVLADHCASSAGRVGLPVDKYHIPLFIYCPGQFQPREIDRLSSQMDLAPTLLSLLDFSYDSLFFGRDILAPDFQPRALIANYQKLGLLTDNELVFLSPGKEISLVNRDSKEPTLKKIKKSYPLVQELVAYYQGADYVIQNRINRWSGNTVALASPLESKQKGMK